MMVSSTERTRPNVRQIFHFNTPITPKRMWLVIFKLFMLSSPGSLAHTGPEQSDRKPLEVESFINKKKAPNAPDGLQLLSHRGLICLDDLPLSCSCTFYRTMCSRLMIHKSCKNELRVQTWK